MLNWIAHRYIEIDAIERKWDNIFGMETRIKKNNIRNWIKHSSNRMAQIESKKMHDVNQLLVIALIDFMELVCVGACRSMTTNK